MSRLASLGSTSEQDSSPESRARKAASHQASAQVVLQKARLQLTLHHVQDSHTSPEGPGWLHKVDL